VSVSAVERASDVQTVGATRYVDSNGTYRIDVNVSHIYSPLITDLTFNLTSADPDNRGLRRISAAASTAGTVTLGGSGATIVFPLVEVDSPLAFTITSIMDGPGPTSLDLTYSATTFKGAAANFTGAPFSSGPLTVVSCLGTSSSPGQRHDGTAMSPQSPPPFLP
jgi:hypothetical protein